MGTKGKTFFGLQLFVSVLHFPFFPFLFFACPFFAFFAEVTFFAGFAFFAGVASSTDTAYYPTLIQASQVDSFVVAEKELR